MIILLTARSEADDADEFIEEYYSCPLLPSQPGGTSGAIDQIVGFDLMHIAGAFVSDLPPTV
jgi:hypothetical protein